MFGISWVVYEYYLVACLYHSYSPVFKCCKEYTGGVWGFFAFLFRVLLAVSASLLLL